jgi:hypothetical protein
MARDCDAMSVNLHGISKESFDLIVNEEVSGQAAYNKRYRNPEWPGEQSGVTGGIGYDFGQQSRAQVIADWKGKIPDAMLNALAKTCGVTGIAAKRLAANLRTVVDIPWETALDVFSNHDVPRYLAMLRRALPGVELLSPHCQGVLLSITFNRGASYGLPGPRYAEMRDIKACVKSGNLARIPALIRSMKRLWPPGSGLLGRRDREAALFEKGLADHHPEHFAADVAPVPDPEVVARVQEQLRNLGYYQVGAIDGSLTPKGKTEDAILAFRNKNGLPLTPTIDDQFLVALAHATPPEVSDERASATAEDLRAQNSETISFTDKVKGWGGKLFGSASGFGGAGALAVITDKATAVTNAKEAVGGLGLTTQSIVIIIGIVLALAVCAGVGLLIWHVANEIEKKRVADYRIGKNT